MFVKVCGITQHIDARRAVDAGATALGFVFWRQSPRYIDPESAADIVREVASEVVTVGVFVDESVDGIRAAMAQSGVARAQLHGDEPPAYAAALGGEVLRSVTVETASRARTTWPEDTLFLLDADDPVRRGGTGRPVPWEQASAIARTCRLVLAGGLRPDNVAEAIAAVRPYGVDVSSGVETAPGIKDLDKLARFIAGARGALESQ